ncbi:hypothetical protein [Mycobacterium sp. SMC-4]|uniref:hypothetical protein n=1 Tax=Mycobacterium sp. SMC-4 TaxID=2857059 RepID=UPI0021B33E0F|nr:hypothetical protein [Mycobacterium sp. SMC-4]UXA20393.1 hypothetical protein KXD98_12975 [Mycobacterium sp. SMC-4]
MRFIAQAGLWTTGSAPDAPPVTAVLEVSGAVLSWTVDGAPNDVHFAFTDPARADWLWRITGEEAHSAVISALGSAVAQGELEVGKADVQPDTLQPLRRLALGHWLRRWWPASRRDGIAELDAAVLDGELALLTAAAPDYFTDDTFDSDVEALLGPHTAALDGLTRHVDQRVRDLAYACAELISELGVHPIGVGPVDERATRQDDYALVAGAGATGAAAAIATGVSSVRWAAVPAGVFDAADNTIAWRIESTGSVVEAVVQVELSGPGSPAGIPVSVRSGGFGGTGTLDGSGTASVTIVDAELAPLTESVAWGLDWVQAAVTVGVEVAEPAQLRERVRSYARSRLALRGPDTFLAEILAAESDY